MTDELIMKAAKQYGTPFYLLDMDGLDRHVSEVKEILAPDIGLCYAMKANPFLVGAMEERTDRIEVCSPGELSICRRHSVAAEKILLSGILKRHEELEPVFQSSGELPTFTAESREQFRMIAGLAAQYKRPARVLLRLTSGNQFGMGLPLIEELLLSGKETSFVKITGLHYFSGTQKKDINSMVQELFYLDGILKNLKKKHGIELEELEYGPGMFVEYFQDHQMWDLQVNLRKLVFCVKNMNFRGRVTLELGRCLAAGCGYYVTAIQELKNNNGIHYGIVDGGIHQIHYDGQMLGMKIPFYRCLPRREGNGRHWMICGALCTGNDVLAKNLWLEDVKCGDILVFERTGAYSMTEGMALFLSRELPAVVAYGGNCGFVKLRPSILTSLFHTPVELSKSEDTADWTGHSEEKRHR